MLPKICATDSLKWQFQISLSILYLNETNNSDYCEIQLFCGEFDGWSGLIVCARVCVCLNVGFLRDSRLLMELSFGLVTVWPLRRC